jgi:hypothetical protein
MAAQPSSFDPIFNLLIPAPAGLISGVIASLIAPWIQWGIEKRRARRNRKIELIADIRGWLYPGSFERKSYRKSPRYSAIRPFLSVGLRTAIDSDEEHIQLDGKHVADQTLRTKLLEEVSELEKKWGHYIMPHPPFPLYLKYTY